MNIEEWEIIESLWEITKGGAKGFVLRDPAELAKLPGIAVDIREVLTPVVLADGIPTRGRITGQTDTRWFQNGVITYTSGPVSAMRMDNKSGFAGFIVVDLATGMKIDGVVWVDDTTMEYATAIVPYVVSDGEFAVDIHKVTAVRVDYVNKRIEVNTATPQTQTPWPFPTSEPKACFECTMPETCKRLDFCMAHKCSFGDANPP